MISYSDIVIDENSAPYIKIQFTSKKFQYAGVNIYYKKRQIHSLIMQDLTINVPLKDIDFSRNYIELVVEVMRHNKTQRIPFSILILKKDEPYIICDIDFTISSTNAVLLLTKNILHIKSVIDSVGIMRSLARKYKIIYLTARRDYYTRLTKLWLMKKGFPRGPLLARRYENHFQQELFKIKALHPIVRISKNGIGIGDLSSDISAYLKHNLRAVKIDHPLFAKRNTSYTFNRGFYRVKSWQGIKKVFNDEINPIFDKDCEPE